MSWWTHISGLITVDTIGRTQPEKKYILDTVLAHLPDVTGSESNMYVHVVKKRGYNASSDWNEFGEYFSYKHDDPRRETQDYYYLILDGDLRDRRFNQSLRELNNWLNRLAKRVLISDICVQLTGDFDRKLIISNSKPYSELFELPTWSCLDKDAKPAWYEYLMWEPAKDDYYPMLLKYKYKDDPENNAEAERRLAYQKRE